jgi:hypothetical protein
MPVCRARLAEQRLHSLWRILHAAFRGTYSVETHKAVFRGVPKDLAKVAGIGNSLANNWHGW